MLIEANKADGIINFIVENGNGRAESDERNAVELIFAGNHHVIGLRDAGCKLLDGFRYYDETKGWPLNPNAKRKKYLTFGEVFAVKENLIAALEFEIEPPARKQIEQAKRLVLRALGEIESE